MRACGVGHPGFRVGGGGATDPIPLPAMLQRQGSARRKDQQTTPQKRTGGARLCPSPGAPAAYLAGGEVLLDHVADVLAVVDVQGAVHLIQDVQRRGVEPGWKVHAGQVVVLVKEATRRQETGSQSCLVSFSHDQGRSHQHPLAPPVRRLRSCIPPAQSPHCLFLLRISNPPNPSPAQRQDEGQCHQHPPGAARPPIEQLHPSLSRPLPAVAPSYLHSARMRHSASSALYTLLSADCAAAHPSLTLPSPPTACFCCKLQIPSLLTCTEPG